MKIVEAIEKAKANGHWSVVPNEPTTVLVGYYDTRYFEEETELDLYADDMEEELTKLWDSLAAELDSASDSISYVHAYGYIVQD